MHFQSCPQNRPLTRPPSTRIQNHRHMQNQTVGILYCLLCSHKWSPQSQKWRTSHNSNTKTSSHHCYTSQQHIGDIYGFQRRTKMSPEYMEWVCYDQNRFLWYRDKYNMCYHRYFQSIHFQRTKQMLEYHQMGIHGLYQGSADKIWSVLWSNR